MSIFKEFTKGFWKENPVLVLVLGMCPTLATSSDAVKGLAMGLATTFVLMGSNLVISVIRKLVPGKIRIPCYIVVIATFVTVVKLLMQAYAPEAYQTRSQTAFEEYVAPETKWTASFSLVHFVSPVFTPE